MGHGWDFNSMQIVVHSNEGKVRSNVLYILITNFILSAVVYCHQCLDVTIFIILKRLKLLTPTKWNFKLYLNCASRPIYRIRHTIQWLNYFLQSIQALSAVASPWRIFSLASPLSSLDTYSWNMSTKIVHNLISIKFYGLCAFK